MDRIPVELWWKIASMACTDGGYTGGSLAAVSRFVHEATRPYRFHSVSLTSDARMFMLSELLEVSHARRISPIQHLFFSVRLDFFSTSADAQRKHGNLSPVDAFVLILHTAAPTLRTLVIHGGAGAFAVYDSPVVFPVLVDFATYLVPDVDNVATRFPSLRRLHLVNTTRFPLSPTIFEDLAPTLTHLRLDALNLPEKFALFLASFMDVPLPDTVLQNVDLLRPEEERVARDAAARLSRLQSIQIRPRLPSVSTSLFAELDQASRQRNNSRDFRLLSDSEPLTYASTLREAKLQWCHLAEGGNGHWA